MENQVSETKVLDYLRSKYLNNATSAPLTNDTPKKNKLPIGEESEGSGEEAENTFLLNKLGNIQSELSKWLEILKSKIKN